eukprot:192489-Prymnesium_polylepis.1
MASDSAAPGKTRVSPYARCCLHAAKNRTLRTHDESVDRSAFAVRFGVGHVSAQRGQQAGGGQTTARRARPLGCVSSSYTMWPKGCVYHVLRE